MAQASQFLIAGNDEHGMNPPTAGKRTPIMPYIDRPFFENEFNRPAKQRFLGVCARIGFNTFDVHPEVTDTSVSTRVTRTNRAGVSCVITFAYNATVNENFNSTAGTLIYYSTTNPYRTASRTLSGLISESIGAYDAVPELGVRTLDIGMLSSVNRPASLVEAGFMTNFREAKLMMDPQFQQIVAEGTAQAVCAYFGVTYLPLQPASAYSLLRRGSRGQQVLYLQWLLTVYGYQPGSPDGIFGSGTQAAVQAFQRDNGLSADGIVGPATWGLLLTDFASAPLLRLGSRGVYVRYLQQKLLSKLYTVGVVDGIFGQNTLSAVRAFQSENGLTVDGLVGPATWRAVTVLNEGRPQP